MAKEIYKIDRFEGGLNNHSDPRDIEDNEVSHAEDVMFDAVGSIRLMGGTENQGAADRANVINGGFGLFSFSHDRVGGHNAGSSQAETGEDYIVFSDANTDGIISIYGSNASAWGDPITGLTNNASGDNARKDVFYFADGALRTCDANFGNTTAGNPNKHYSYIKRDKFDGNAGAYTDDAWFSKDQNLTPPVIDDVAIGSVTAPNAIGDLSFSITVGTATNTKNYNIAASFVYDGNQESLLTINTTDINLGEAATDNFKIDCSIYGCTHQKLNPRITHVKAYIKSAEDNDFILCGVFDLKRGATGPGVQADYNAWSYSAHVNTAGTDAESLILGELLDTYENQAGFSWDTQSINARYATAVMANRQIYIGNIKYTNADGEEIIKNDAMINTPVGKFDTFPYAEGYISEASINDGDKIIKLEEYNDRILQFKKTKLHIINISGENQELEATYKHRGVESAASVTKTDQGIAWANKFGVFLYDGTDIVDLLVKNNSRKIAMYRTDETNQSWEHFLTADKDGTGAALVPMVGYSPKHRKLIIADDATAGATTDPRIMIFDFITLSWSFGSQQPSTQDGTNLRNFNVLKTNFINDYNGDLVYAHTGYGSTGKLLKYKDEPIDSKHVGDMQFRTKDIDFGSPGVRKKIYKVYVTYYGGSNLDVNVRYRADQSGAWQEFDANLEGDANVHVAELKPNGTNPKNVKSIQLRFSNPTLDKCPSTFKINDISIVYRTKYIK